jgi:TonB family protein
MRTRIHKTLLNARRELTLAIATILLIAGVVSAQQPTQPAPPANQAAVPAIPSYPNSAKGLEKLMKDMMKLVEKNDSAGFAAYTEALTIPDAHAWFRSVFGEEVGAQLEDASESRRKNIRVEAKSVLSAMLNQKKTELKGVRFEDSCNDLATAKEYPLLTLREHPEPLFDIRFSNATGISEWGLFAYVDGGFRFLGDLRKILPFHSPSIKRIPIQNPKPSTSENTSPDTATIVAGSVQAAKVIYQEIPKYPIDPKLRGEQGSVILHVVIGKDGNVHDMNLVEGQCEFAKSAMDAVQKWRYSPTRLNGAPVEVDTTITVNYKLGGP